MSLPCIIYKFIYHISSASNILSYYNIITQHQSFYKKMKRRIGHILLTVTTQCYTDRKITVHQHQSEIVSMKIINSMNG